jgi:hypothetical protein
MQANANGVSIWNSFSNLKRIECVGVTGFLRQRKDRVFDTDDNYFSGPGIIIVVEHMQVAEYVGVRSLTTNLPEPATSKTLFGGMRMCKWGRTTITA